MKKNWKTLSSKKAYSNPYFFITNHDVIRPDGNKGKYYVMHSKTGVVIIPFDGKKIYLVNQYRYTFKKRFWELPAGGAENRDYLQQVKKELREETGFTAGSWKYLGQFACGPGHTDHMGKVFLAQRLKRGQPQREGGEADMIVKAFSLSEIDRMIRSGKLTDSWTIVPIYFFKQYLKQ